MNLKTAFLWDESFLWGLMAYEALKKNSLPFELIRSEDIKNNCLSNYKMLFVPGGWASNKLKSLGDEGVEEIRNFVKNGGNYFGICGGAGLATLDGLGLLNIKRRATKNRVPSFSGRIKLKITDHPIWIKPHEKEDGSSNAVERNSQSTGHIFHAWWPSQFVIQDRRIKALASYGEAMPDAFSSDLCVGDIINSKSNWSELEAIYKINLDPDRLIGEPAVVEGYYGNGKVILSLIHFDTPDDKPGHAVLISLWQYLLGNLTSNSLPKNSNTAASMPKLIQGESKIIAELVEAAQDLIDIGCRNFLWFRRNSMLFQWRRGIRGLEYCTLYVLIKKISGLLDSYPGIIKKGEHDLDESHKMQILKIRETFLPFYKMAKNLLMMERIALQNGHITYEKCDDDSIQAMRAELFSNSKSYGGMFKEVINRIDNLLYELIKACQKTS